jgi:hypothetical protein|tara:strand:+ start:2297 stop:2515 length:219 start_codon:yes stop_codon:yes gene_type:complete
MERITSTTEINELKSLKKLFSKEYADYSLQKLYNLNELLIKTINQLQKKQIVIQEMIVDRLDNIAPKETKSN